MRIAIVGATGYTGGHLVDESLRRGHEVIAVSRSAPAEPRAGVEVRTGSVFDAELFASLVADADVLAVAIKAVTSSGSLAEYVPTLLAAAQGHGTRVGIVGGAGSLLAAPGGPALYDTPEFPDAFRAESRTQGAVLDALRADRGSSDWFYLSPAGAFGRRAPGERTGTYRTGSDVLVTDADGRSAISGADFAIAFLDEVEVPEHSRTRFTVAY